MNQEQQQQQQQQQPYTNAYIIDSFQLELTDPNRDRLFFLPDQAIHIQIVDHELEPAIVNLLHTNLYTISIRHAQFQWQVKRKYKNFLKLYEAYALFKTKQNIRNAAHLANLPPVTSTATPPVAATAAAITQAGSVTTSTNSRFKSSDHFKLFFQSIASDFAHSKHILEKFLQDVVDHKTFRNHNETLKFLEVSHLSFVTELGGKNKEGLVKKHAFSIRFCSSASASLNCFGSSRWLIVKDTWIAYLDTKSGEIRTVLLVDKTFRVLSGLEATGEKSGLLVENLNRQLFVKCYNEKRANEWRYAIQHMLNTTGREFCSPVTGLDLVRFESFAPIRYECLTRWFVDGADYMEAIADSVQAAKEEIFITGFFLSPEIYLKRPVLVGDRWRLDKLLKQKAEQGVKIYILIYKEIEITLPINSAYSKRTLSHRNIKVLRHPDHLNGPIMWAHHEKLVIIDQTVAYFGGIDLCYGRWDDHCHRLTDLGSVIAAGGTNFLKEEQNSQIDTELLSASPAHFQLLPNESVSSSTRSKQNSSVRLIQYKQEQQKPHFINLFHQSDINNNEETAISTTSHAYIQNSSSQSSADSKNDLIMIEEQNPIKLKLKKLKAIRMLSAPQTTLAVSSASDEHILPRNFLIDNMTDYYNNFINKTEHDKSQANGIQMRASRFERLFMNSLKRSKSLELNSNSLNEEKNQESHIEVSHLPTGDADAEPCVKSNNLTLSLKALESKQERTVIESAQTEHSIFNKLKKIKQFKESLKRYAIPNANNNVSYNVEKNQNNIDDEDNDTNEKIISVLCNNQANSTSNSTVQLLNNLQGSTKLWIGKDYCNFIFKDVKNVHSPFQDSINRATTPRMPWHDIAGCVYGSAARDIARHFIERWNYIKTKKVRNNKSYFHLVPKSYQNIQIANDLWPSTTGSSSLHKHFKLSTCNVQTLRSVSSWSAGTSRTESSIHAAMKHLIRTAKHYIYIENQFFISFTNNNNNNININANNSSNSCSGDTTNNNMNENQPVKNEIAQCLYNRIVKASQEKENFKVYIFLPLIPGYEGEYGKLKSSGVLLHTITHYNNQSINMLIKKLADQSIDPFNYIFFFGLRTWAELSQRLITELIYVHSKLMIVDDRACLIGSANINDRSLLGNRDSEVALYIEDTQFKPGILNKKPAQCGVFTSSLRLRLFKEFLGELGSSDWLDPCTDEFYKQTVIRNASQNTRIYDTVFKVIPCDYVSNFEQLREYQKMACLSQTDQAKARDELKKIKGYIVLYPYRFLVHQDLTPPLGTKEKLLPNILWT